MNAKTKPNVVKTVTCNDVTLTKAEMLIALKDNNVVINENVEKDITALVEHLTPQGVQVIDIIISSTEITYSANVETKDTDTISSLVQALMSASDAEVVYSVPPANKDEKTSIQMSNNISKETPKTETSQKDEKDITGESKTETKQKQTTGETTDNVDKNNPPDLTSTQKIIGGVAIMAAGLWALKKAFS